MNSQQPLAPRADERLRSLLDARRRLTDELSLTSILNGILRLAGELIGVRYVSVAVLAADGTLEQFLHRGMDESTAGQVAARSAGVVADALPMASMLGVPIRVRGELAGELFLADPAPDRLDADDESLAEALAATAATAIGNARLAEEARRSKDWLHASGELARVLLGDTENQVLPELIARATRVADADYAGVILPIDDRHVRVVAAIGVGAEEFRGLVFDPSESALGRAIRTAETARTRDMTLWARRDFDNRHGFGPAMIVPLLAHADRGAMVMMRLQGRAPFTPEDVDLASAFAAQLGLALELNDARADAAQMRAFEERTRIVQGLHDDVIQRLFATGVGLQALAGEIPDDELAERLRRHIADLDDTLDRVRSTVFGPLDGPEPPPMQ